MRLQIFRLQIMSAEPGNTQKKIECVVQRVQDTSRAYTDADPGLVRPTATAAVAAAATSTAPADDFLILQNNKPKRRNVVTDIYDRIRRCSFVLVQHNRIIRVRPA